MRPARLVGLVVLASCAQPEPWIDFGEVALDASGQTRELAVPWTRDAHSLRIDVSSATQRCFQVDSLVDADEHAFIARPESGPFCIDCEQRSSAARGGALFQFPSRGGVFAPGGALRFRLGLRDCDTLTRSAPSGPEALRVKAQAARRGPARGRLELRLVVTPASAFFEKQAALAPVLEALNSELASAALTASLKQVVDAPVGTRSDATFSRADPSQLEALLAPSPALDGELAVVLAGCLKLADPVLGTRTEVTGYTPHTPGGRGGADGVFISGALCDTPAPVPINWAPSSLARVMAHELGHMLGLYHSVEADGTTDQLDDTDAANVMFHRPGEVAATGFSATQAEVMRAHPAVAAQ